VEVRRVDGGGRGDPVDGAVEVTVDEEIAVGKGVFNAIEQSAEEVVEAGAVSDRA
jgi:hypothetical protein